MTFEECGRGRTGWDTYSKEDREIVKHFWDGAREGMVSEQDVLDGCGCTGATCWCIRHVVANLRGEGVVENPEPMVSVERVRDAVRTAMRKRNLLGEDAVLAAIDASDTGVCKTCGGEGWFWAEDAEWYGPSREVKAPCPDCPGTPGLCRVCGNKHDGVVPEICHLCFIREYPEGGTTKTIGANDAE